MEDGKKHELGLTPTDITIQAELFVRDTKNKSLDSVLINPVFNVQDSSNIIRQNFYSTALDAKFV
jgi:hypothetical protein